MKRLDKHQFLGVLILLSLALFVFLMLKPTSFKTKTKDVTTKNVLQQMIKNPSVKNAKAVIGKAVGTVAPVAKLLPSIEKDEKIPNHIFFLGVNTHLGTNWNRPNGEIFGMTTIKKNSGLYVGGGIEIPLRPDPLLGPTWKQSSIKAGIYYAK